LTEVQVDDVFLPSRFEFGLAERRFAVNGSLGAGAVERGRPIIVNRLTNKSIRGGDVFQARLGSLPCVIKIFESHG
jgi:hypothetical protein